MFCGQEAGKPLRKRLLRVMVGCFVSDIICLLVTISALVVSYMDQVFSIDLLSAKLTISADILLAASLVSYLFTVKLKSLVGLVLNSVLLAGALTTRVASVALASPLAEVQRGPTWKWGLLLGCAIFQLLLLLFVWIVWRMIPERKWRKKFDLATKFMVVKKPSKHSTKEASVPSEAAVPRTIETEAPKPQDKKSTAEGNSEAFIRTVYESV